MIDEENYKEIFEKSLENIKKKTPKNYHPIIAPPADVEKLHCDFSISATDKNLFENTINDANTDYHHDDEAQSFQQEKQPIIHHHQPHVVRSLNDGGIDKRTFQRLQRGLISLEDTIDLHGMDEKTALTMVKNFITSCFHQHKRCILIMTGKGKGILQKAVRQYTAYGDISPMILATTQAQPKDGGSGALYIYLRKTVKR